MFKKTYAQCSVKNDCYSIVINNKQIIGYVTDVYEFGKDNQTIETVDINQNTIVQEKICIHWTYKKYIDLETNVKTITKTNKLHSAKCVGNDDEICTNKI